VGKSSDDKSVSAQIEGDDVVKLDGLEALAKAVKMAPPIARIGILGNKTSRKAARKEGRKFLKARGFFGKSKSAKEIIKEEVKQGGFGVTNATIGAAHEFGSLKTGLPKRSFLREPLIDNLQKELDKAGAFSAAEQAEVIKQKSLLPWTRKVALAAENIVKKAFETGGFGKWAKLKPKTLARKTVKDILVETTQLRDSITTDVKSQK
jgi:phage gpG-like protein